MRGQPTSLYHPAKLARVESDRPARLALQPGARGLEPAYPSSPQPCLLAMQPGPHEAQRHPHQRVARRPGGHRRAAGRAAERQVGGAELGLGSGLCTVEASLMLKAHWTACLALVLQASKAANLACRLAGTAMDVYETEVRVEGDISS